MAEPVDPKRVTVTGDDHVTGILPRCPCEWLMPPTPLEHIDSCDKQDEDNHGE